MEYVDLFLSPGCADTARRVGWSTVCAVSEYRDKGGFIRFRDETRKAGGHMLAGALVSGDVIKKAREALDCEADIILADGRTDDACREASESWEVDLIVNPELNEGRDLIDQRNSGLDHVIASFMAERGTGYCVNASSILNTGGVKRSQLLGRIMQNIRLARRYGVKVVFASGAADAWCVRSPHDLALLARTVGLTADDAARSVSENPGFYAKRAADRGSPDVLMKGLEVVRWGTQQRKPKRRYGWY